MRRHKGGPTRWRNGIRLRHSRERFRTRPVGLVVRKPRSFARSLLRVHRIGGAGLVRSLTVTKRDDTVTQTCLVIPSEARDLHFAVLSMGARPDPENAQPSRAGDTARPPPSPTHPT